jgi:hypothetical protein
LGIAASIMSCKEKEGGRRQEAEAGRRQEAGGRRQEAGGRRQEAGGRRQEAGGRRQEAGGRRQGHNLIMKKKKEPYDYFWRFQAIPKTSSTFFG